MSEEILKCQEYPVRNVQQSLHMVEYKAEITKIFSFLFQSFQKVPEREYA
jgi:hypothetical protein